MNKRSIHIVGAGPGNLVAAINLAKAGIETIIHEQGEDVGLRFNGDFQGLENWSFNSNVIEFLHSIGVSVNFRCEPYYGGEFYGPSLKKRTIRTTNPLFYLVERGNTHGTLDQGLKQQALDAGVKIQWNNKLTRVPKGTVIVGTGPKTADVIAKGIVFQTSHPDACYGFLNDRIAPKGYAYLLVNKGQATFATCLFKDFRHEKLYFQRALDVMQQLVTIDINDPKEFGGFGNFFLSQPVSKDNRILYTGENAGFQDALWGFGLKYAMYSGYLASLSIIEQRSYEQLCETKLKPVMETSLVNRWLYYKIGNFGYESVLRKISASKDILPTLRKHHRYLTSKRVLFSVAKRWYHTHLIDKQCMHEHCDCVWCRHCKTHHQATEPTLSPWEKTT